MPFFVEDIMNHPKSFLRNKSCHCAISDLKHMSLSFFKFGSYGTVESEKLSSPKVLEPTNLFHRDNVAITFTYFSVGIVGSLLVTPLNVYLVNFLNVEPKMQNTLTILQTLPVSSIILH
jgi:hypothetical protein